MIVLNHPGYGAQTMNIAKRNNAKNEPNETNDLLMLVFLSLKSASVYIA
jgi:hypothetical protein